MARPVLYLDTNVLIGLFELPEPAPGIVEALLDRSSREPLITSEITLSEVLVGPLRRRDSALEHFYRGLLSHRDLIRLKPVTRALLLDAAAIRAATTMRLPDAIHIATAKRAKCTIVLSQDKRLAVPSPMLRVDPFVTPLRVWR